MFGKRKAWKKLWINTIQKCKTMAKNKYEFFSELLETKRIEPGQKERLLKMMAAELKTSGYDETSILERLKVLEEGLGHENGNVVLKSSFDSKLKTEDEKSDKRESAQTKSKERENKLPKPLETKNFLSLFNNSEGLKYLTHKFNSEKPNYEDFIQLCKSEFEAAKIKYPNVPVSLLKRIEEFAFSKNAKWFIRQGEQKIYPDYGWSEPNFIEWYKKDLNRHPALDSKWNNEMIIPFKETIEVRAGSLQNILENALNTSLGESKNNFSISQDNDKIKLAEFYTDVDRFKYALFHIFSMIKGRSESNFCFEIDISYDNTTIVGGVFKQLIITHIGSEPTKRAEVGS